jgi:sRNA-binding carbon storage regulator CsrA
MALVVNLDVGDALVIDGQRIRITVLEKTGRRSKVAIEAPRDVRVQMERAAPDVAAGGLTTRTTSG